MFALLIALTVAAVPYATVLLIAHSLKLHISTNTASWLIPVLCGCLYYFARYIPEPPLTAESITLAQHFIGGGFVSALVTIYIYTQLGLTYPLFMRLLLLFAVVSTLGVSNELLEFISTKSGIYAVDGSDAWWDLVANTLGAVSLYFIYEMMAFIKAHYKS